MEADRERVRRDGGERRDLGDKPAETREERDPGDRQRDRRDLQPVDGETVVQPRRAEVGEQRLPDEVGPSEDDRLDDIAALAGQTTDAVAREPPLDTVAEPVDPAASSDDAPRPLRAQHDVDSLAPQPCRLVEAVRRTGRRPKLPEQRDVGALRRRAAEW